MLGFLRISFGIFPIVIYTGYTDFPPNEVTWVLSEEIITGIIVAPGNWLSTAFCKEVSHIFIITACNTNLYFPPPSPSVHVSIDPNCLVWISIVPFRFELEVGYKVMTAVKFFDTVNDITAEKFMCLASMLHFLSFKLWAVCW